MPAARSGAAGCLFAEWMIFDYFMFFRSPDPKREKFNLNIFAIKNNGGPVMSCRIF